MRTGHFKLAANLCQFALREPDAPVEFYYNLARARMRQRLFEQAHACLTDAIRREPGYADAHSLLGSTCVFLGAYDEAKEHLCMAIALDPKDPIAWGRLGICYDDMPDHKEVARMAWAQARRLRSDKGKSNPERNGGP